MVISHHYARRSLTCQKLEEKVMISFEATDEDGRGQELLSAALACDEDRVSDLLSASEDGINVNYQNSDGWSPLHAAACKGHANIIRLLHQAGAELGPRTKFGFTPLHWAGYNGRRECVMLLLLLGAEIDTLYPNKWTVLHWASAKGRNDLVRFLIECGADTELKDKRGHTPRDVSDEYNKEIKDLFDKFRKQEGYEKKSQLLKNAINTENWEVATILSLNGASEDQNIFNNLLYSSLHSATVNVDCVFALMTRLGRDLSSIDKNFKMKLLSAAGRCKNTYAVRILSDVIKDDPTCYFAFDFKCKPKFS